MLGVIPLPMDENMIHRIISLMLARYRRGFSQG
jgi:hypothetical protein